MMKMDTKYMKLIKFFIIFIPFFLFLVLVSIIFNPHSEMKVNFECVKYRTTENYCSFNCSFISDEDAKGRIIVTHTAWAAIFDKEFNITQNQTKFIEIQLPRRDYTYYLRGGFYNQKKYGTVEGGLYC